MGKCKDFILGQDVFGPGISIKYPSGEETHRSIFGGCFNMIITLLTWCYFIANMIVLFKRGDTLFITTLEPNHYKWTEKFSEKNGFQFAIGVQQFIEPG